MDLFTLFGRLNMLIAVHFLLRFLFYFSTYQLLSKYDALSIAMCHSQFALT